MSGVVLVVALLGAAEATVGLGALGWAVGLGAATSAAVLLARALQRTATTRFGPANVVTLVRASIGQVVAALVAASFTGTDHRTVLVALAAIALLLDAVDGQVARRTGSVTALGARFDMETDAFLILVLSVAAAPTVGWWVLTIGTARYALLGAEQLWPWLRTPVPRRYWRKVVAAVQGVTLAVVVSGVLGPSVAVTLVVMALLLLAESFGRDVLWLARRRHRGARVLAPAVLPLAARSAGG